MKSFRQVIHFLLLGALFLLTLYSNPALASSTGAELNEAIVYYVKPGASGDCLSWTSACDLQTALTHPSPPDQIWVAVGTYFPTTDANRSAAFQLKSGVAVYGGFPAAGGEWETRDWVTNLTTLSGDIGDIGSIGDNSYHVLNGSGVDATAILDGFTIIDGNANGDDSNSYGGGMYNSYSSPSLTNVTFRNNSATYAGGGMYNWYSNPSLSNVTFSGNNATVGGGMSNQFCSPTLISVTFSGNSASSGGGMSNDGSNPSLTNVTFNGNIADNGGGMFNQFSSPSMSNVTFSSNSANNWGGGMYQYSGSPSLANVTFSGNAALIGGGMYNDSSSLSLTNSILWGNTPDQINGSASVTYSDIQEGYAGTGNINEDPLLSPLADNGGFTQTHALGEDSPAIDAGDPTNCPATDQRGFMSPIDGNLDGTAVCDMGSYEYGSNGPRISLFLPLILK